MILNSQLEPDNLIFSSGKSFSIKEFVDKTLELAGFKNFTWNGEGLTTQCLNDQGQPIVKINPKFYRKIDIDNLVGNHSKLKRLTGWSSKISFEQLVEEMFDNDYNQESLNILKNKKITTFKHIRET